MFFLTYVVIAILFFIINMVFEPQFETQKLSRLQLILDSTKIAIFWPLFVLKLFMEIIGF